MKNDIIERGDYFWDYCVWDNIALRNDYIFLRNKMDKKINKILSTEKKAVKETKSLLKMDKKQDKKIDKLEKKNK